MVHKGIVYRMKTGTCSFCNNDDVPTIKRMAQDVQICNECVYRSDVIMGKYNMGTVVCKACKNNKKFRFNLADGASVVMQCQGLDSDSHMIYGIQNSRDLVATGDGELASILHRASQGEELTELENFRFYVFQGTFMNLWELAFVRHTEGLMPDHAWDTWNRSATQTFTQTVPRDFWEAGRAGANIAFMEHVDAIAEQLEQ